MMDLLENGVNEMCHHCLYHLIAGNEINFIFICSTTSFSATKVHYWPVPPFQSTRIVGSRITAPRYRAEQGHTDSLIAVHDPKENFPKVLSMVLD
jgi:hypothetical protein